MDDEFSSAAGKLHEPKMKAKRSMSGGVRVVRAAGRKDRHSKVWTARGTKDRRVRLSPKTAILFYDVQERLGYDRPSNAIDWLMKEARAAIDALHHPPAPPPANRNHVATIATNVAESNGDNPVSSGFGVLFDGGTAPPLLQASSSRREDCREQFLSSPTPPTPLEIMFDASSEIARLQRMFSWNHTGEDYSSVHYPAANAHVFAEREPLQSSYSTDSPQFQGFGFPNFCAAATFKGDDENIPLWSNSFSTASSFLGYAE